MHLLSFYPGHFEYEHNDRKVKRKHVLQANEEKENPKCKSLLPVKIITSPWQKCLVHK